MKTWLETIREREAKATPGPWRTQARDPGSTWDEEGDVWATDGQVAACGWLDRGENAAFVAGARKDIPALLALAEAAQELGRFFCVDAIPDDYLQSGRIAKEIVAFRAALAPLVEAAE